MRVENYGEFYATSKPPIARLEQAFLQEMLKHVLSTDSDGAFSGGAGEQQFSSFLNEEYAQALAGRVDLGLKAGRDG